MAGAERYYWERVEHELDFSLDDIDTDFLTHQQTEALSSFIGTSEALVENKPIAVFDRRAPGGTSDTAPYDSIAIFTTVDNAERFVNMMNYYYKDKA